MELQKINLGTSVSTSKLVTNSMSKDSFFTPVKIVSLIVILVLGLGTGYLFKNKIGSLGGIRNSGPVIARNVPEAGVKEGDIIGIQDTTSFKDSSTGVLQKGGLDGEGSHNLLRPGGVSQIVYLTSSVVDLDAFVGHQVTVWGETFKGQKVGWLMDVGRVKVEKLNAPNPQ